MQSQPEDRIPGPEVPACEVSTDLAALHVDLTVPWGEPYAIRPDQELLVRCPYRVDLGSGWQDTPPYTLAAGGIALNLAAEIGGPMSTGIVVRSFRIDTPNVSISLRTSDGALGTAHFSNWFDLQREVDRHTALSLPAAAVLFALRGPRHPEPHLADRLGVPGAGGFGLEIETHVSAGTGLGGSTALATAIVVAVHGLFGSRLGHGQIVRGILAFEQVFGTGGGWQDQVGVLTGGVKFAWRPSGWDPAIAVEVKNLPEDLACDIEAGMVLVETPYRRRAADHLGTVMGRFVAGEPSALAHLAEIGEVDRQMAPLLCERDWPGLGAALDRFAQLSARLDPAYSNPALDRVRERLAPHVLGSRILGAGGGGYFVAVLRPGHGVVHLNRSLESLEGVRALPLLVNRTGLTVEIVERIGPATRVITDLLAEERLACRSAALMFDLDGTVVDDHGVTQDGTFAEALAGLASEGCTIGFITNNDAKVAQQAIGSPIERHLEETGRLDLAGRFVFSTNGGAIRQALCPWRQVLVAPGTGEPVELFAVVSQAWDVVSRSLSYEGGVVRDRHGLQAVIEEVDPEVVVKARPLLERHLNGSPVGRFRFSVQLGGPTGIDVCVCDKADALSGICTTNGPFAGGVTYFGDQFRYHSDGSAGNDMPILRIAGVRVVAVGSADVAPGSGFWLLPAAGPAVVHAIAGITADYQALPAPGSLNVVFDVGGTTLRVGLYDRERDRLVMSYREAAPSICRSPASSQTELADACVRRLALHAQALRSCLSPLVAAEVCVAFPAALGPRGTLPCGAPTLWGPARADDLNLAAALDAASPGLRWVVVNDVHAQAVHAASRYREARLRVGVEPQSDGPRSSGGLVAYVMVGSGVNSKVMDPADRRGLLSPSLSGPIGEIGHAVYLPPGEEGDPDAAVCDCGAVGHLAAHASGRALERNARRKVGRSPWLLNGSALLSVLEQRTGKVVLNGDLADLAELAGGIDNSDIVQAVLERDALALELLDDITRPLAAALTQLVALLGVEAVLIGGGLTVALGEAYLTSLRGQVSKLGVFGWQTNGEADFEERILAVPGSAGRDTAGLLGAGLLLRLAEAEAEPQRNPPSEGRYVLKRAPGVRIGYTFEKGAVTRFGVEEVPGLPHVGNGVLAGWLTRAGSPAGASQHKVLVVGDTVALRIHGVALARYFEAWGVPYRFVEATTEDEPPESQKTLRIVESRCLAPAEDFGLARDDVVLGFGGGVALDLAGLTAQLFRRGVPCIRIPTTLLGVVDAAVGIKNAVNFGKSKNRLGSFQPPAAVLFDLELLRTLPHRQFVNGFAEMLKIGIIADAGLLEILEEGLGEILEPGAEFRTEAGHQAIDLAIRGILDLLGPDPYEIGPDLSRLADFGHTISPALQMQEGLQQLLHGEAVAIDMAFSTEMAYLGGHLDRETRDRIQTLIAASGLPLCCPQLEPELIRRACAEARKHRKGTIHLTIPIGPGRGSFLEEILDDHVAAACTHLANLRLENIRWACDRRFVTPGPPREGQVSACSLDEPGKLRVTGVPVRLPAEGELLVAPLLVGLCGTDVQMWTGQRVHRPRILGHEAVALVLAGGAGTEAGYPPGVLVTINPNSPEDQDDIFGHSKDGFFAEAVLLPVPAVAGGQVIRIPAGLRPLDAVLCEPLACVLHNLRCVASRIRGEDLLIVGAGTAGTLFAVAARMFGARRVVLLARDQRRLDEAVARGIVQAGDAWLAGQEPEHPVGCFGAAILGIPVGAGAVEGFEYAARAVLEGGVVDLFGGFAADASLSTVPVADAWGVRRRNSGTILRPGDEESGDRGGVDVQFQGKDIHLTGSRGAARQDFVDALEFLGRQPLVGVLAPAVGSLEALPRLVQAIAAREPVRADPGLQPAKVVIDLTLRGNVAYTFEEYVGIGRELPPAPAEAERRLGCADPAAQFASQAQGPAQPYDVCAHLEVVAGYDGDPWLANRIRDRCLAPEVLVETASRLARASACPPTLVIIEDLCGLGPRLADEIQSAEGGCVLLVEDLEIAGVFSQRDAATVLSALRGVRAFSFLGPPGAGPTVGSIAEVFVHCGCRCVRVNGGLTWAVERRKVEAPPRRSHAEEEIAHPRYVRPDLLPVIVADTVSRGLSTAVVTGVFDLVHDGHVSLLATASQLADRLVVALDSDLQAFRHEKNREGTRPIHSLAERVAAIGAIEFVDGVTAMDPWGARTPNPVSLLESIASAAPAIDAKRPAVWLVKPVDCEDPVRFAEQEDAIRAAGGGALRVRRLTGRTRHFTDILEAVRRRSTDPRP